MNWNMGNIPPGNWRPDDEEEVWKPGWGAMRGAQTLSVFGLLCAIFVSAPVGILLGIAGMLLSYLAKRAGYSRKAPMVSFAISLIAVAAGAVLILDAGLGGR